MALIVTAVIRELQESIDALDRHVSQVERPGEVEIAHDAAALDVKASRRIAEREGHDPPLRLVRGVCVEDGFHDGTSIVVRPNLSYLAPL